MLSIPVLLPDGRPGHVSTDSIFCGRGWHARLIVEPLSGPKHIVDSPSVDLTPSLAAQRARVLAELIYPRR